MTRRTLVEIAFALAVLVLAGLWVSFVVGCSAVESLEPNGAESACDRIVPAGAECAVVYQCARQVWDGDGSRFVELCIRSADLQAAELANGPCWPSRDERFKPYALAGVEPPCFWCCEGACPRGANALNGSFCPGGVSP